MNVETNKMYSLFMKYLWILLIIQYVEAALRIDPLVNTNLGFISGLRSADGQYSRFLGIPYAKVDESNPFGPSSPYGPFEDVFEAYSDAAECPQVNQQSELVGTLDCLRLNIYVPNTATFQNRLPVFVWIHGGGFTYGSDVENSYGPRFLVRHDVIVVSLNYRLGPYGFMCLDIPEVPGNQGLKDQLLALRWIKENIESFGGDSNKITIVGESAGGISVDYHLLYSNEDLFNKIIVQSGTALGTKAISEIDTTVPLKLAEYLGFPTDDTRAALSFLSSIETNLVVAALDSLNIELAPCVENDYDDIEKFVTDYPVNVKLANKDVSVMIGFVANESLAFYGSYPWEYFLSHNLINDFLEEQFNLDDEHRNEMANIISHYYLGDDTTSENVKWGLIDFHSDYKFVHPTHRSIEFYKGNGLKNIFMYMFSYDGGRNFNKLQFNITFEGAIHADELGYLFDMESMEKYFIETSADVLVLDQMTAMWTNFVKYGDPTPSTSDLLPIKWEPVSNDVLYYLDIDSELTLHSRPFHERVAFWDLFYKLNEKYQKENSYD